jgi:2'-5' RNA ligase
VNDLTPRLERAASRTERFSLAMGGLGRFGDRVLYLKVGGDRPQLRRIAERTTAASRRAGANLDEGRFRPHVTVARSRRGAQLRPLVESGQQIAVQGWQVNEFVMVNSILGGDRRYEILGRYALGSDV